MPHFTAITERLHTDASYAWEIHTEGKRLLQAGEPVILLSAGDPDHDTPAAIVEHAVQQLRAGRTKYAGVGGEEDLCVAIAKRHQHMTGQAVGGENVVVFPGAQNALFTTALCTLQAGDECIVPEPRYVTYEGVFDVTAATPVDVSLAVAEGFRLHPERVAAAVTRRTRAIVLNTPHNPTGIVFSRTELEGIAAIACEHDLWVISDEVYDCYTYGVDHVAIASLPGMAKRTVTLGSMSKSHAMQGWRVGWAIAPLPLCEHLRNVLMCMLFGVAPFSQDAARFALTHELEEIAQMQREYRARRDLVCQQLDRCPGIRCHWPNGGMFLLVDVRGTGRDDQQFARELLDAERVCVLPAATFGPSAHGHIRISLTAPIETLAEFCERLLRFTQSLAHR